MRATKNTSSAGSIDDDLTPTTIFALLADDRRRHTLQYLRQAVGVVPLWELADHIGLLEGDHTYDRYERICTDLVHTHVPKLVEAGVVTYDRESETVELLTAADQLGPYLDLAAPTDGT